jgi:hypothetical protein
MPSLREVQRAIRASLVEREDGAAASFILGEELAPEQRLSVYRNTFASALANALRLSFPAVERLVGTGFFEGAARIFAHGRPPASAYLDEYGSEFAGFLACFPPAASLAYLPDVARLEWAVTRALHAPDAPPLDPWRVAQVARDEYERIRFVVHPSVSLVAARYPVDAVWRAVLAQDDAALGTIDIAAGPVRLIVERLATGVDVSRIDEPARRFAGALFSGQPLGSVLAASEDIDAPALLAGHLAAGRFVAFSLAPPPDDRTQENLE